MPNASTSAELIRGGFCGPGLSCKIVETTSIRARYASDAGNIANVYYAAHNAAVIANGYRKVSGAGAAAGQLMANNQIFRVLIDGVTAALRLQNIPCHTSNLRNGDADCAELAQFGVHFFSVFTQRPLRDK